MRRKQEKVRSFMRQRKYKNLQKRRNASNVNIWSTKEMHFIIKQFGRAISP